jgi:hypothetical protein
LIGAVLGRFAISHFCFQQSSFETPVDFGGFNKYDFLGALGGLRLCVFSFNTGQKKPKWRVTAGIRSVER